MDLTSRIRQLLTGTNSKPAPSLTRRTFLRGLGATAVFTAAAPLLVPEIIKAAPDILKQTTPASPIYIPAHKLDYVPHRIEIDTTPLSGVSTDVADLTRIQYEETVKVLMLQATWYAPLGGELRQGSEIRVPTSTAGRWLDYGIAVPAPGQPEVTPNTARRSFEAAQAQLLSANQVNAYRDRLHREELQPLGPYPNSRLVKPADPQVERDFESFYQLAASAPSNSYDYSPPGLDEEIQRVVATLKENRARPRAAGWHQVDFAPDYAEDEYEDDA